MARRLRIARIKVGKLVPEAGEDRPDPGSLRSLRGLIREHFSAATASLFAEPKASVDGEYVDWYTDLEGQPTPLADLPEDEKNEAREVLQQRVKALDGLAARLVSTGSTDLAASLRRALTCPGEQYVYVIGGQPVMTFWGYRDPDATAPGTTPVAGPLAAAGLAPNAVTASTQGPAPVDSGSSGTEPLPASGAGRGGWLWWIPLLAILGVAALFALGVLHWRWPPWGPDYGALIAAAREEQARLEDTIAKLEQDVVAALGVCDLERQLADARLEEAALQGRTDALEGALQGQLSLCPAREAIETARQEQADLAARVSDLEARLAAKLDDCRQQAQRPPPPQKPPVSSRKEPASPERRESPPKEPPSPGPKPDQTARTPKPLPPCPGERPPEDAPDVAVVLDASGSMQYPASASTANIQEQLMKQAIGMLFGVQIPSFSGPSRLDSAKKGINSVVRSLPADVDVGLVVLADCPRANRVGFFSNAQRGRLLQQTNSLRPMRKTPLASGVQEAANMVDGVNAPAVIVVISDGEDTCGGNPCAVAQAMKRQKPKLTINVVDILGDGASNCLARATGGKVLQPKDGLSFERTISQAASEAQKPAHCR